MTIAANSHMDACLYQLSQSNNNKKLISSIWCYKKIHNLLTLLGAEADKPVHPIRAQDSVH